MGRIAGKPRRYACFTPEEQAMYESLNAKQRKYIDWRGQGYSKSQSYQMSGYGANNPSQAAYLMEKNNSVIPELISRLLTNKQANELTVKDSQLNRKIDAIAKQESAEKMLEKIDGADGETARRIQFYRDIMNGKIKTVRKTTLKDAAGKTKSIKIEEVNDVDIRIKARKELDKILGLTALPIIDNFSVGQITVNVVDASKKEELEDERNKVNLNIDDVEVIDGKEAVIIEDADENEKMFNVKQSDEETDNEDEKAV